MSDEPHAQAEAGPSTLNATSIRNFLTTLPRSILTSSSPTHLPTTFPLSFPTPLHLLNFLSTLHIVHLVLSEPRHARYFLETSSNPKDTTIKGTMGLFLASEEEWDRNNLLSCSTWKTVDEHRITEFFGIQTVKEKQHESIEAIRVGERWEPGVSLADSLVSLFKTISERLEKNNKQCLGGGVRDVINDTFGKGHSDLRKFTKLLIENVIASQSIFGTNFDPTPDGNLPPGTVRLLQDLSYTQHSTSTNFDLPLPPPSSLSNITALPISIPVLIQLSIIDLKSLIFPSECKSGQSFQIEQVPVPDLDLLQLASTATFHRRSLSKTSSQVIIELPSEIVDRLQMISVQACETIWRVAAELEDVNTDERGWMKNMTFLDICRAFEKLEEIMVNQGVDIRIVPV